MSHLEFLKISSIEIEERLRPLDEEKTKGLAESIKRVGLLSPILVRKIDGHYILVAGRHRIAACELLGGASIPAYIYVMDDHMSRAVEITENLHRNELTALERATHIAEWVEVIGSIDEAAKQISISRDKVSECVKIASRLSPEAQAAAKDMGIANNHRDLLSLVKGLAMGATSTWVRLSPLD
jgi:ParB family transcriptional regulator, chromosome partitioning protein